MDGQLVISLSCPQSPFNLLKEKVTLPGVISPSRVPQISVRHHISRAHEMLKFLVPGILKCLHSRYNHSRYITQKSLQLDTKVLVVLEFELRAANYHLGHSVSPFLCWVVLL
jgi:hypothetical protein